VHEQHVAASIVIGRLVTHCWFSGVSVPPGQLMLRLAISLK